SWAREARLKLAFAQRQLGQLTAAEGTLEQIRQLTVTRDFPDRPLPLSVVAELALLRVEQGRPDQALNLAEKALADYATRRRPIVPFIADLQIARGRALLGLGHHGEAVDALGRADAFWRDFDSASPWAAEAAHWLGKALVASGDAANGRRLMEQ